MDTDFTDGTDGDWFRIVMCGSWLVFGSYTTVPLLVLGLLSGLQSAYRMAGALVGKNDKDDLAGVYDRLEREKLAEKQKRNSVSDVE